VTFDGSSEIVELKIVGDWAWMRSRLRVEITPPGGKPVVRRGYALTVLQKDSQGNWAVARDANLLGPPTGAS
jgi:ketosteroid isomerase-like protein